MFLGSVNPCSDNNGLCSQLCLLGEGGVKTCACGTGYVLKDDAMTCQGEEGDCPYSLFHGIYKQWMLGSNYVSG